MKINKIQLFNINQNKTLLSPLNLSKNTTICEIATLKLKATQSIFFITLHIEVTGFQDY